MTHPLQPFRNSKHLHIPTASRFTFQRKTLHGSGAVLTARGTQSRTWPVSTTSILMVPTTDSSEVSRTCSSTLRNVLTMSQMVGKSAEERHAASVMLQILVGSMNKTAAEVAVEIATDAPEAPWTKSAARGACGKHCRTSQSDCM